MLCDGSLYGIFRLLFSIYFIRLYYLICIKIFDIILVHQNYVGVDSEKDPFFLSVVLNEDTHQCVPLYRAILFKKTVCRSIKNTFRFTIRLNMNSWHYNHKESQLWVIFLQGTQKISLPYIPNKLLTVKQILSNFPNMDKIEKGPKEIFSPDIQKDLLLLEEQEGSVNFKFGIIYMKQGQTSDDEILSNGEIFSTNLSRMF